MPSEQAGESEGMIPVIKKGSNAKKEAHASLPATDIAAPDGAIEMQPTGSDYVHHGNPHVSNFFRFCRY